MQPDGKIILVDRIRLAGNTDFALIRCNVNGSIDNTFGFSGKVVLDLGADEFGYSVTLQEDGKIVASGVTDYPDEPKLGVVRYNSDGSLDNTFGNDGVVTHLVGPEYESDNYVAIHTNGKILVAGTSTNPDFKGDDINLVRLTANGNLDNSFGNNGIITTDIGDLSNLTGSIALQSDSRVLVGSNLSTSESNNRDFAVLRYTSGVSTGINDIFFEGETLQVYPNPFQESGVLEYTLINSQIIDIDLYDSAGNLVQSFVRSEIREKGSHKEKIIFDFSISPGNYFLTIGSSKGRTGVKIVK